MNEARVIKITRTEGPTELCGIEHTFDNTEDAEAWLRKGAMFCSVGYDKHDLVVAVGDDVIYKGRINLRHKHVDGFDLLTHVIDSYRQR